MMIYSERSWSGAVLHQRAMLSVQDYSSNTPSWIHVLAWIATTCLSLSQIELWQSVMTCTRCPTGVHSFRHSNKLQLGLADRQARTWISQHPFPLVSNLFSHLTPPPLSTLFFAGCISLLSFVGYLSFMVPISSFGSLLVITSAENLTSLLGHIIEILK